MIYVPSISIIEIFFWIKQFNYLSSLSILNQTYISMTFAGVSYFVYGEKINTYSNTDPVQQEFIEAGLDYIGSLGRIGSAIPLYKLFPTKQYKEYVKIVYRIHAAGMCTNN